MQIFDCSLPEEALEGVSRPTTTRDDVSSHACVPGPSSQFEDQ